ncbi:MAG TPA: guanine deaminase [Vicinamibacterales bacterium]|nr:guanine deaminase [Vicinamibacterales bacterium]
MTAVELLRAPFFHTPTNAFRDGRALVSHEDGGLLIRDGRIVESGAFASVREAFPEAPVTDWRGGFVLPGFVDTHVHFPQLRILGGLGRTLLDWLEHVALPEEARMADLAYATGTADRFVRALAAHGTTTALVFGSHFGPATAALFDAADAAGLRVISGLVVSDRYLRPELHQSPRDAYRDSTELIRRFHRHGRLLYAVTPRFALSASDAMLEMCGTLLAEHDGLRVQTHINESLAEIAEVPALFPWAEDYLAVYERFGLTGSRTVLAHDVHPTDSELERLAAGRTAIAHCPSSNAALGNGIFPLHRHVEAGVACALGTDVGGGTGFGMLKEGLQAHLMQRVASDGINLDPARLCYLVTKAGAEAVGLGDEIGDFLPGKAADLVYVRPPAETPLADVLSRVQSLEESLAAIFTLAGPESIREVRVAGQTVHRAGEPVAGSPLAR